MDLRYFDMKNQELKDDLKKLSDQELVSLQRQISVESQNRQTVAKINTEKVRKDFLASHEARQLKSEILAFQSEFSSLPNEFDLGLKIVLNVKAEVIAQSVTGILDEEDGNPLILSLELEDPESLPESIKADVVSIIDELNDEYVSANELLKNSFDGQRWQSLLQKLKGLDDRLQRLYDAGLDLEELMEE